MIKCCLQWTAIKLKGDSIIRHSKKRSKVEVFDNVSKHKVSYVFKDASVIQLSMEKKFTWQVKQQ